jgi:hypothetical protein
MQVCTLKHPNYSLGGQPAIASGAAAYVTRREWLLSLSAGPSGTSAYSASTTVAGEVCGFILEGYHISSYSSTSTLSCHQKSSEHFHRPRRPFFRCLEALQPHTHSPCALSQHLLCCWQQLYALQLLLLQRGELCVSCWERHARSICWCQLLLDDGAAIG